MCHALTDRLLVKRQDNQYLNLPSSKVRGDTGSGDLKDPPESPGPEFQVDPGLGSIHFPLGSS